MPIQGNNMSAGPIMRKTDPQNTSMTLPRAERERMEKARAEQKPGGAMILGSYMTREDLLDYIRDKRQESQAIKETVKPPPPPTERQMKKIREEQEAGKRRVAFYAAQAQHRPPAQPEEISTPMAVPANGEGTADTSFTRKQPKVTEQKL